MAVIAIPKILTDRLTQEGAKALAELLEKIEVSSKTQSIEIAEGKFEKRLAEEIGKLRGEIHGLRADMIRWTFIFIFGQFWMIVGTLFAFFK